MRILIITDAWSPQVNGVVRTLNAVIGELRRMGHEVLTITPEGRPSVPFPLYREISLTRTPASAIAAEIVGLAPDAVHIATEGPLGWKGRHACQRLGLRYTTGFHTRFAEYAAARLPLPGVASLGWSVLRRFHAKSEGVMVPTRTLGAELERRGFANVRVWTRGVDRDLFRPMPRGYLDLPRPIILHAGRLAIEKGIEDFLRLDVPGTKVVVGDGPERERLSRQFPQAKFLGYLRNQDYARALSDADVMVFPSRTDTFGLVMIEAMACGTPVAAYDVSSPCDVIADGMTGALDDNLARAVTRALTLPREAVQAGSAPFTWQRTAEMFLSWLVPCGPEAGKSAA